MAICILCEREMLTADGCTSSMISIDQEYYSRIPYGDPRDLLYDGEERCHDCGATKMHYHHMGCDAERCPKCGGQLITCDCIDVEYVDGPIEKPFMRLPD